MTVIGKCDPAGAFKGQLCSSPRDRNRSCHLSGFEIWERDIHVHSWPWKISGMFISGCKEMRVIEKTFLIKSINLLGSHGRLARSCHRHCGLTRCRDPGRGSSRCQEEGAAVAALRDERRVLKMCHSLTPVHAKSSAVNGGLGLQGCEGGPHPMRGLVSRSGPAGRVGSRTRWCPAAVPSAKLSFLNSSSPAAQAGHVKTHLTTPLSFLLADLVLLCPQ